MGISIIIPVLNEEKLLPQLLEFLLSNRGIDDEIIVVDGGSLDTSKDICKSYKIVLIETQKCNRAHQMNEGAKNAKNDLFYFLHADAMPPKDFSYEIKKAVQEGHTLGGYKMQLGENKKSLQIINSYLTKLNWLIFQGGGDMSLFVTKKIFYDLSCFNESYMIMEDFEFMRRARKKNITKKILDNHIHVSDRKYKSNSYLKVQIANLIAFTAFSLGIRPLTIKTVYNSIIFKS